MDYLIVALEAEARPLIQYYALGVRAFGYPLYVGEEMMLLICGVGLENAMMGTSALLGYRPAQMDDRVINIGLCASHHPIGSALLIHQLYDAHRTYYPDILYTHTLIESPLYSVDTPHDRPHHDPIDMEGVGFWRGASRWVRLHQIALLKIVSDHYNPSTLTRAEAHTLMHTGIEALEHLRQRMRIDAPLLIAEEPFLAPLREYFTRAQYHKIMDALCYYRLSDPTRPLPILSIPSPSSKHQRQRYCEEVCAQLMG